MRIINAKTGYTLEQALEELVISPKTKPKTLKSENLKIKSIKPKPQTQTLEIITNITK
jgi:phosphopantetheine adenylyltransferase